MGRLGSMSGEMFMAAVLALAVQGLVMYVAIRFALHDDRLLCAREEAKAKTAAEWKARRAEERKTAELVAAEAKQQ